MKLKIGQTIVISNHNLTEIDGETYTEEQLLKMNTIKVKDLNLSNMKLVALPKWVKKCEVQEDFNCVLNRLTTLEGAPKIVKGDFNCSGNNLNLLKGASKTVGGDFYCSGNNLISLKGAPRTVGGDFYCAGNRLTTLEGAPKIVKGDFYCYNNKKKFTEEDVNAVSKVKGNVKV